MLRKAQFKFSAEKWRDRAVGWRSTPPARSSSAWPPSSIMIHLRFISLWLFDINFPPSSFCQYLLTLTRNPKVVKRWFYINIIRYERCVRVHASLVSFPHEGWLVISKCVVLCSEVLEQCLPKKRKELGRVLFIKSRESNGNSATTTAVNASS